MNFAEIHDKKARKASILTQKSDRFRTRVRKRSSSVTITHTIS